MKIPKRFLTKIIGFLGLFVVHNLHGQQVNLEISARVDTSKASHKEIYRLYKNYLNSKPDSLYKNPHWLENKNIPYKSEFMRDRSAGHMFGNISADDYLAYYQPTVLQIDSLGVNKYQIKTIFSRKCPEKDYEKYTPDCIVKLYAERNEQNEFKLVNVIDVETKSWKTRQLQNITYVIHPSVQFNPKEAKAAEKFCKMISKRFAIPLKPITYYVLPNTDEFGKLYNFDYWLSYLGGQTDIRRREIFTSYGNFNFPHEFIHLILPLTNCPMIVNEGVATFLAGPGYNETFEDALKSTAKLFKTKKPQTLYEIMSFQIRNEFDNNALYCTGAVLAKFVYEKKGDQGLIDLLNCEQSTFEATLVQLLEKDFKIIEQEVFNFIDDF